MKKLVASSFRGILALVFGFIALFSPGIVLVTLLLCFGFVAIFSGIFIIIEGIAYKDSNRGIRILVEKLITQKLIP